MRKHKRTIKKHSNRLSKSAAMRTDLFFGMMHQALGMDVYQPLRYKLGAINRVK